ncbi:MAG: trigger factor [Halobacteriovorax sp.]|nr:trigger factor [Halobacteriovorax sp.]|tara:strand:- start:67829 stop:69118 length:1290 start_codon:yes stop_codon:yes gene_type:complete
MSYKVEEVNGCTKKIVFNFETLDLTTEIKAELTKKQKTVSIKGFRKGKAPLSMVEKLYGPQLEFDALNQFVQNQLIAALTKEELNPVGQPSFEDMKYDAGKSVSFNAVVEVFPTVEIKDLSKLSFKKEKVEIKDEDVESIKNNYLGSKAEMIEITDEKATLGKGHTAVMNFQGTTADGEKPESMKGDEFLLEIGSGQFIPGFEEGMIGMKKGEKKSIDLTFPEEYHAEELKGAKVVFDVELLEIKEKKLPEFNDELAKEFGFESVEDFNTKNRENLVMQKEKAADEKLHQEILETLIKENTFDVPGALVAQQENYLKEDVKRNLSQQGFNEPMMEEYFQKWADDLKEKAQFQVRSGLILDTLAKKFEVETSDSDLDAKIEETAKGSGLPVEQLKQYYSSDENIRKNMMYAIREEKTFEALKSQVKVEVA